MFAHLNKVSRLQIDKLALPGLRHGQRRPPDVRVRPRFEDFSEGTHYDRELDPVEMPDKFRLVIEALAHPGRVLDVGCHTGFLGKELRRRGWAVHGLEANAEAAAVALANALEVTIGSVEHESTWNRAPFDLDAILFLDILEHTYDPWAVLDMARPHLRKEGRVLVTLPNVASWKVLRPLLLDRRFVPASTGLDDPTHIRFFTLRDAMDMLRETGYEPLDVLPAWPCVPAAHRLSRWPLLARHWSSLCVRYAPSLCLAVPLLVAQRNP